MVDRVCVHCGKAFKTYMSEIRKGGGKFCSIGCGTKHRNLTDNPAKRPEARRKISENHADVSGVNNPMYGRRGADAPNYIDGRSSWGINTQHGRIIAASGAERKCAICGSSEQIEVHHLDGVHRNNDLSNLVYLCADCHRTKAHTYKRNPKGQFCAVETHDITEVLINDF